MVLDVEAYSKANGIPVGAISKQHIKMVDEMASNADKSSIGGERYSAFASMCNTTQSALETCVAAGSKKSVSLR
jgi:hypothetical protein